MLNVLSLFLLLLFSLSSYAVELEPSLDQQGMFYFNMTFDAGASTKTEHDFGFRFDRTLTQAGNSMTMNQLTDKPAVFNVKMDHHGLKTFELNGVDYSTDNDVSRADDDASTSKKSVDIPVGVIIGALIGSVAIASGF